MKNEVVLVEERTDSGEGVPSLMDRLQENFGMLKKNSKSLLDMIEGDGGEEKSTILVW